MRANFARGLTAAVAAAGAAGAMVLPMLTLGTAKTPSHAFAIPAPAGDIVIQADRLPEPPPLRRALPSAARSATPTSVAALAAVAVPRAPRIAPAPAVSRRDPASSTPARAPQPKRLPVPTPLLQPEPAPTPVPEAPVVRNLVSVAPVAEQPVETGSQKHKRDKGRGGKEKGRKNGPPIAPSVTAPPTAVVRAAPVEPLPSAEAEPNKAGRHDDEHGGHGKGHDKKK